MRRRLSVVAILICAACAGPTEASRPEALQPPVAPRTTDAEPTNAGSPEAGSAGAPSAVRLVVTETTGLPPALVARVYEAAREPVRACRQSGGGKVNVRIVRQGGVFHLSVEPGASLDPSARHCVLEALSTVELEDTAGNVGGPAIRPSGFTSLITVSW